MAKVSGVLVESISKITSVNASSIQSILGVLTSNIPGWPGASPSCESITLSYGIAPGAACAGSSNFYDFNSVSSLLYQTGYCGNSEYYAPFGFYVNENGDIFSWIDEKSGPVWSGIGNCNG